MINLLVKTITILEVLDAWYFSYSAQEHLGLFGILGGQFEKKISLKCCLKMLTILISVWLQYLHNCHHCFPVRSGLHMYICTHAHTNQ